MRKYLITGLLVWLPLAITVWVLLWVLGMIDGVFDVAAVGRAGAVLPLAAQESLKQLHDIPGLGWSSWSRC